MIIGGAGSGKSTLAREIGAVLSLPVFHMDRDVFWLPGWVERAKDDQVRQVERIVAQERWVFEGNNSSTFHLRAARAEMLIWLDVPLWKRLFRAMRRNIRQRGKIRPDMAEGCTEQLRMLPGFVWFILSTAKRARTNQQRFFASTTLPKIRLTALREVNAYVETLK